MQGTYNCIPETNHVSRVYSVAAILYLQFMVHAMLFAYHHHLLHVLALSGPSSERARNTRKNMYKTLLCIISRKCSSHICKTQ
jgi:hypothetical protein